MQNKSLYPGKILLLTFLLPLLTFVSCEKEQDNSPVIEKDIAITGFNRVFAGEKFNVTVTKGASFQVHVKGPSHSVADIEWTINGPTLDIHYSRHENNRPRIDIVITLPNLLQVNLSGASTGTVNGFQDEPHVIRTVLSGASKLNLNGTGINTQFELSGASELNVTGATGSLYGNLSGASKLYGAGLISTEVDINASGASWARVHVTDKLFAEASGGSKIYFRGNPAVRNTQTSGGGQIIPE